MICTAVTAHARGFSAVEKDRLCKSNLALENVCNALEDLIGSLWFINVLYNPTGE